MTDEQLQERLAERRICEAEHTALKVPHNGFGWTGSRCSQCGFMFFEQWEPGLLIASASALPDDRLVQPQSLGCGEP